MKLLKKIKETIQKDGTCNHYLSKDIVNLIDQEVDLSTHCGSVTKMSLVGLRMRLKNLFYKFLEHHSQLLLLQQQQGHKYCNNGEDIESQIIMTTDPIFKVKPVSLQRCTH